MKPMIIDSAQTAKVSAPTLPATPPIENSTSAGTPLATQKAPFQSIARCSVPDSSDVSAIPAAVISIPQPSSQSPEKSLFQPWFSLFYNESTGQSRGER